jgi:hypothetical protein
VHAQLRREGRAVNKKRVERLMRVGETALNTHRYPPFSLQA